MSRFLFARAAESQQNGGDRVMRGHDVETGTRVRIVGRRRLRPWLSVPGAEPGGAKLPVALRVLARDGRPLSNGDPRAGWADHVRSEVLRAPWVSCAGDVRLVAGRRRTGLWVSLEMVEGAGLAAAGLAGRLLATTPGIDEVLIGRHDDGEPRGSAHALAASFDQNAEQPVLGWCPMPGGPPLVITTAARSDYATARAESEALKAWRPRLGEVHRFGVVSWIGRGDGGAADGFAARVEQMDIGGITTVVVGPGPMAFVGLDLTGVPDPDEEIRHVYSQLRWEFPGWLFLGHLDH